MIGAHTQRKLEIILPLLDSIRHELSVTQVGNLDFRIVRYYPCLLVEQDDQSLFASGVIVRNDAVLIVADSGIDTIALHEAENVILVKDPAEVHDWR